MSRATQFISEIQQQRIINLKRVGMTQRQIVHKINPSQNFLNLGSENSGENKRTEGPPRFTGHNKRVVLRKILKNRCFFCPDF